MCVALSLNPKGVCSIVLVISFHDHSMDTSVTGVTEDEAALYDRQIRLWGLEAQNHMRQAHVAVVSFTGVAEEIVKNIVLAGIGALTIVDAHNVEPEDLSASLFFRPDDMDIACCHSATSADSAAESTRTYPRRVTRRCSRRLLSTCSA